MSQYFLLVLVLALLSLLLLVKYLSLKSKIQHFRQVINQIVMGDYTSRVVLSPEDKLGDVGRNINELSTSIQNRLSEISLEKEKIEAVLGSMEEGVIIISDHERLLHLNPSFKKMFDIRSLEWKSKYYWEILPHQLVNESIREVLKNKKPLMKEIVIVHPKELFFNMQISPVLDSEQGLMSLIAVFHDVTELKHFERLRTEFVGNVSHELKTPLTSIKGFVETLKEGAINDKSNAIRFLDIIHKHTQRLENLVNDLLIISSLESKEMSMNFALVDITNVINSVISLKKKQIEEFKHTFSIDIPSNLPKINADSFRIEQVLINLLDNAIKFTPSGGKIAISVMIVEKMLCVQIEDNGPGIPSEFKDRIFERFFRVDKSRSQETGGTGLGLSIVKHIVEAHYGRVELESKLGLGSTFRVFLPIDML